MRPVAVGPLVAGAMQLPRPDDGQWAPFAFIPRWPMPISKSIR